MQYYAYFIEQTFSTISLFFVLLFDWFDIRSEKIKHNLQNKNEELLLTFYTKVVLGVHFRD